MPHSAWLNRWRNFLAALGINKDQQPSFLQASPRQVLNLDIDKCRITARVQTARPKPCRLEIRIKGFPAPVWEDAATAIASQAALSAALASGELPWEVDKIFRSIGVSLFPQSAKEIAAACSCAEIANPCRHAVAVFCTLIQEFAGDPLIIFLLRGKSKEDFFDMLDLRRSRLQQKAAGPAPILPEGAAPVPPPLLPAEQAAIIQDFWQTSASKGGPDGGEVLPALPGPPGKLLQDLGNPPGWPENAPPLAELLRPVYEYVAAKNR